MCSDIGTTSRVCAMYSFTGMLFTVSVGCSTLWRNGPAAFGWRGAGVIGGIEIIGMETRW